MYAGNFALLFVRRMNGRNSLTRIDFDFDLFAFQIE